MSSQPATDTAITCVFAKAIGQMFHAPAFFNRYSSFQESITHRVAHLDLNVKGRLMAN